MHTDVQHNDEETRREIEQTVRARAQHFHPLEVFPWFRRFPYSVGRDFLYTFIWNAGFGALAVLFAATFSGRVSWSMVGTNFLIANFVGYSIHLMFMALGRTPVERYMLSRGLWGPVVYYTGVSSFGVVAGLGIASLVFGWKFAPWIVRPGVLIAIAFNCLLISLIIGAIYFWRERSLVTEMRLARERERVASIEREATLANLRALQAQIEPHFLFNTLANVVGLIHIQPDTAKLMLEKFIAYLRASLAATREQETTLGVEFALMADFLAILQIRMGSRLNVVLDLPAELAASPLPSMLLQPLVENAIKHGLEPKMEGGDITLRAAREGELLRIDVIDTGQGFGSGISRGIGLANVRERLEKLFSGRASLVIEENSPCGTRAILRLPMSIDNPNTSTGAASGIQMPQDTRLC